MPGVDEPLTDALLDPVTYAGGLHAALDAVRAEAPLAWDRTAGSAAHVGGRGDRLPLPGRASYMTGLPNQQADTIVRAVRDRYR